MINAVVVLIVALSSRYRGVSGQCDALQASMFEELISLRELIYSLQLEMQELQLTTTSCDDTSGT